MYMLGASYLFDGGWTVSGGYIFSENSVPEEWFNPGIPDSDRHVFSLGVMAYEMLMARLPYGGGSFIDIGMKQAHGADKVECGDLPPRLADAIRRAIAYEKEKRPASPIAFADEMKTAL